VSPINLNRNRWPASRRDSAALRQQWNRLRHPLLGPHAPDPLVLHPSAPGRPQMDPLASRHPPLPLLRRSQRQGDRRPAPRPDPDFTKGSPAPRQSLRRNAWIGLAFGLLAAFSLYARMRPGGPFHGDRERGWKDFRAGDAGSVVSDAYRADGVNECLIWYTAQKGTEALRRMATVEPESLASR
jgi:hypothetical protein